MTFEEILDQALDMLRRRGRVTYGALQRQFALDDAYLADLKDAMLYANSRIVDDAGRGLRWTGEPLSTVQRAFEGVGRFYGEAGVLWLVRALLQRTIALYNPEQHHILAYLYGGMDHGMVSFGYDAWALWMRGYPAQSHTQSAKALSLAQQLTHPYTLARTCHIVCDMP
jgi:hypothetical protein